MKSIKIIIAAVLVMAGMSVMGQTWNTNGDHIYNTNIGNVGIGDGNSFTPEYLFHVNKSMIETAIVVQNTGDIGGAAFRMIDDLSAADWKFKATMYGGFKIRDQFSSLNVFTIEKDAMENALYIKEGGNVGIGTTEPATSLDVNGIISTNGIINNGTLSSSAINANGKITCKEVEVTMTGWPDYVFNERYELKSLYEVEDFIMNNGHLPGVKSAEKIESEGLNVGDINKQLMEKVEELTLYVIQLQKQIDKLEMTNK